MSFEKTFKELMIETVTVYHRSSHSSYGSVAYSTAGTTFDARVVRGLGEMRGLTGQTVQVTAIAYIASTSENEVRADDKIVLPDGSSPPIAAINHFPDDYGLHHVKVGFGF